MNEARQAALTILQAFEDSDFVIAPSGSCTGMLHHYPKLFQDDPINLFKAQNLQRKSYEFSQFMVQVLGVTDLGAVFPHKVTYHPSCHGTRILGIRDEPMLLMQNVKAMELVPLPLLRTVVGLVEPLP